MTAVVILHFNRIDLTKACVESVLAQTSAPRAVIVVDNGSTGHDEAALVSALPAHPALSVIRTPVPGGFSYGNNIGIRAALRDGSVESVLVLNNDTTCPTDLLSSAEAYMRAHPRVGLLGCEMEGRDGGEPQAAGKNLSKVFALPVPAPAGTVPDYLQGSCIFIRRSVLETVGLLDESFHFFCEDADYSLRVRRAGWELAVLPDRRVFHYGSATISGASERRSAWYRAGHRLFLKKWFPHPWARAFPSLSFRLACDALCGRFSALRGNLRGFFSPDLGTVERLRAVPDGSPVVAVDLLFLVPGQVGGSETYVMETLQAMAAMAPDVTFLLFTNLENHDGLLARFSRFPNVVFAPVGVRAASKPSRFTAECFTLPRLVRRYIASTRRGGDRRIFVLWCPGNLCLARVPCRIVTSILDMQYRRFPEDYTLPALWIMRAVTAISVRRSDGILTISEFSKSEIADCFPGSEPQITVTTLAASDEFRPGTDRAAANGKSAPKLLCVANTYPHKHVEDAVAVFARLADEFPTLALDVVGRPRLGEPAVEAAIAALPPDVRARVNRIHRLAFPELVGAFGSCGAFLFPSRYEGFGLPVLEALKTGARVVACRAGSIPEVGGRCASYFDPGDIDAAAALVRDALRAPPRTDAERNAVLAHVGGFTWERTAGETLRALLRKPRVTVVTPCFNSAATLPTLLDGIDAQASDSAWFELEHIVMDGGSTDGTLDLLAAHAKPWRKVFSEPDKGPADAINKGFARAAGEYAAWLNADDAYAPHALARMVAVLERRRDASFCFGRCPIIDGTGKEIRRPITRFKEVFFPFPFRCVLQTLNFVSQPATLFRKSALDAAGPLRIDLKAAWDYDLLLRLRGFGRAARVTGRAPVSFFRWTPNSISGSNFARQFDEELELAKTDAGRFSFPAILHRAVRLCIVAIYTAMAKLR